MEKQWKNYGSCKVSNYGDIVSLKYRRNIGWKNQDGYIKIGVTLENKRKIWSAHRLVYFLFGKDYNTALEVNHKDGDKHNYNIDNLEWVSHSQNMRHAYSTGLRKPKRENPKLSRT